MISQFSDDDLDRMEAYGGPDGGRGTARALLADLRAARAEVQRQRALLDLPEAARAVREHEARVALAKENAMRACEGLPPILAR